MDSKVIAVHNSNTVKNKVKLQGQIKCMGSSLAVRM